MKLKLAVAISLLCTPALNAYASDVTITTPILSSMDNFRDIAGTTTAYSTTYGGTMRSGVFYRSNVFTPSAADLATLETLGITHIYDLRTSSEIAATPDTVPSNITYTNINILGDSSSAATASSSSTSAASLLTSLGSASGAEQYMDETYKEFVDDKNVSSEFGVLLNDLASTKGAALFHCTAGKDRTGWATAILQSIAGVSTRDIYQDYLATNTYTAARINAELAAMPAAEAAIYAPLLTVEASYLTTAFDEVIAEYGSMQNYLTEGLGLSQATIYVLRAKMVLYSTLPGQAGMRGNDAEGAELLNELQNSSLSGAYTNYNYYLQSAIDAGTLGGVQSTVGGQVYADTSSYLLRQNSLLDDALAPYTDSSRMKDGESNLWATALSGYLGTGGSAQASSSNEHSTGVMMGLGQRFNSRVSGYGTFGYDRGSVGAAGGEVKTNLTFVGAGGRLAFNNLDAGAFLAADVNAGWVNDNGKRQLGGGLGTAWGDTEGQLVGGTLRLGYASDLGWVRVEPSVGGRVSYLKLDAFQERGSELALDMNRTSETSTRGVANLKFAFRPSEAGNWAITPAVNLGYEHEFSNPTVSSSGELYGYSVTQDSSYHSHNFYTAGLNVIASHGPVSLGAQVAALGSGDTKGVSGSLNLSYIF
ncbi:tyrosine-protein phosphatase [Rouxiella badensis]|uniref:tyrosine-protein phosphatase n=1 Tax=Rouxiella badensis TaxID=1646377 RepID=UPI00301C1F88